MITQIILNRKLLKQIINESVTQNKEILAIFFSNNSYKRIIGDDRHVGDLIDLLKIPDKVNLIFHTHLPTLKFQDRMLIVYPSVNDVEMSIFLSKYPQYKDTVHAVGSLINGKYIICYWNYNMINFQLLNSIEYKIFSGQGDLEENRKILGEAIGLQCLDLDSLSLTEIMEQEQLNFYRKIDKMIKEHDTVVFNENIDEIKYTIERMYPILEKSYDYISDVYRDYKGIVYTYYLLLSVSDRKIRYAKILIYGNKWIEIITMSATDENVVKIGNKEYTIKELEELCKSKTFCVSE